MGEHNSVNLIKNIKSLLINTTRFFTNVYGHFVLTWNVIKKVENVNYQYLIMVVIFLIFC